MDLTNVTLSDALRIVETFSGTFWKPVTANTIFVAQDTAAKRRARMSKRMKRFMKEYVAAERSKERHQTAIRDIVVGAGNATKLL